MIETAENKAKEIMGNLKNDLQELISNYENLVKQREKLVSNLQRLADTTMSSVEDAEKAYNSIDIHAHTELLEDLSEGGTLEKMVEEKFQQVGSEIKAESNPEEETSSADVIIIDSTKKVQDEESEKTEKISNDQKQDLQLYDDIPTVEKPVDEEEKEAAIKEAEKQFKVHEPKPSYFDERPKSAMEKEAMEKKKQSGSFFDQFE